VTRPTLEFDIEGPAAPPRANGELVFAEPWEGRAFGLAMALVHGGTISYEAFPDGADRTDRGMGGRPASR
jgi:hypothetical protein